eukprot:TRINITY_DN17768_c0_g1_i1.p1 TRINITY_DN17768_c0_g1~~TRINITY_DN17768_c0_g1_i1.p1  ORF type:complete len:287 (-),score=81.15 TRINITY_DN17768_c0_g1_i1:180-1040(-)
MEGRHSSSEEAADCLHMAEGEEQEGFCSDLLRSIDARLSDYSCMRCAADRCGLQPSTLAGVGVVWFFAFVVWGVSGELLRTLVALVYPMFASFKALETEADTGGREHWLRFWVSLAMLTLAEGVLHCLLVQIPFYHILRLVFVVLLYLPVANGAQALYHWIFAPLLRSHRNHLEAVFERLDGSVVEVANVVSQRMPRTAEVELQDKQAMAVRAACMAAAEPVAPAVPLGPMPTVQQAAKAAAQQRRPRVASVGPRKPLQQQPPADAAGAGATTAAASCEQEEASEE